jgi:hypothetical protein
MDASAHLSLSKLKSSIRVIVCQVIAVQRLQIARIRIADAVVFIAEHDREDCIPHDELSSLFRTGSDSFRGLQSRL